MGSFQDLQLVVQANCGRVLSRRGLTMRVSRESESRGGRLMARVLGGRDRGLSHGLLAASNWWCCLLELVLWGRGGESQPPDSCFSCPVYPGFTPFFTHPAVHLTLALLACAKEAVVPDEILERKPAHVGSNVTRKRGAHTGKRIVLVQCATFNQKMAQLFWLKGALTN
eukprot:1157303-Pelagomonas_calceolata.AAC.2